MIAAEKKTEIIREFARQEGDSGSPEVQIALLTQRIKECAVHMRSHKQDYHGRRGLVAMVSRRNKLLRYLQRTNRDQYLETIQRLGLRK